MDDLAYRFDTAPEQHHFYSFEFHANGEQYFRIWIVNFLLTILTLGIYSAWATVRSRRYFYQKTVLDQSSFEYTGDAISILKGRLIVVAMSSLLILSYYAGFIWMSLVVILMAITIPWLIVRVRIFSAQNTVYQKSSFYFADHYPESYQSYVGWPLAALATLGILIPVMWQRQVQFRVENLQFQHSFFQNDATIGDFYPILFAAIGIGSLMLGGAWCIDMAYIRVFPDHEWILITAYLVLLVVGGLFLYTFVTVKKENLIWANTSLEEKVFECDLHVWPMYKIYLTNLLYIVMTFGFYSPWAMVKSKSYRLARLKLFSRAALNALGEWEQVPVLVDHNRFSRYFDWRIGL